MPTDQHIKLGKLGELLAMQHFERLGFKVLERNHRTRFGELDLIVCNHSTLVFCEVKTRRVKSGQPFDSMRPLKCRQVRRLAAAWLAEQLMRPRLDEIRFDAVGILVDTNDSLVALDHLEAAF